VTLRLATFNIRNGDAEDGPNSWPHRKDAVVQMLREIDADIFGLQEVMDYQLRFILDAMPRYQSVGVGRIDGVSEGEFAPILFRKDRLTVAESGWFWLSETPEIPGSASWNTACERICTWARFGDLTAANTHLDHISEEARLEGVRLILRRVSSDRAVVMGDLNAFPTDEPIQEMVRQGFLDSGSALQGSTFHDWGATEWGRIDYIFCKGLGMSPAQIVTKKIGGRYASDHYPVVADADFE
jgi:endonuclease/exonuclease/phosphatase family metal-dependent hydrolase